MHRQRLAILILAVIGSLGYFLPSGHTHVAWAVKGMQVASYGVLGLSGLVFVLVLFGNWKREMSWHSCLVSFGATGLIALVCIGRLIMIYGQRFPTFDENDPRAQAFYKSACSDGEMKACVLLGTCYWTGTCGVTKDTSRAVELFEKACYGGEMGACAQLGTCFEFGECGLRRDGARAVSYYERACQGGEMDMCSNLGVCYHKGQCGLSRDTRRATALYEKACKGGYLGACHNLTLITN